MHFVGWRDQAQMHDLMRRCRFFALTSRAEGLPLVIVEAMMNEKPVIATSVDGVPDIVDHEKTGLLTPPEDAEAVAEAIQRLASDEAWSDQLGRAAHKKAIQEFNWSAIAQRYLSLAAG